MAAAAVQAETEVGHKSSPKRTTRRGDSSPALPHEPSSFSLGLAPPPLQAARHLKHAVRVEERSDEPAQEKALLARGLQECLTSGIWSMAIWLEALPQRKARNRRIEKARERFERSVSAGPDLGDAWGWWLKFEQQHGTAAQQEDVIMRCQVAEPGHCETWQPIANDGKTGGSWPSKSTSWSLLPCNEEPVLY
ncbi:hypothetical protein BGY98DRAFT_1103553 [Russula aff. rugulosa BPL654]|nr:hypothetical protein BGY98DRAFT_1103553 [Russula aff. rugulosa BPL654]